MGTGAAVFTSRAAGGGERTAVSTGCPTPVSPRRHGRAGGRRGPKGLTWSIFKSTEVGTDGRSMCQLRTGLWKWWRCFAEELAWLPTSWKLLLADSNFSCSYLCSKSLPLTHTHYKSCGGEKELDAAWKGAGLPTVLVFLSPSSWKWPLPAMQDEGLQDELAGMEGVYSGVRSMGSRALCHSRLCTSRLWPWTGYGSSLWLIFPSTVWTSLDWREA